MDSLIQVTDRELQLLIWGLGWMLGEAGESEEVNALLDKLQAEQEN